MRRAHGSIVITWYILRLKLNFLQHWGLKICDRICLISAPTDFQGNMAQRSDHHMLEEENDKMVDHLSSKVQALKSVLY